MTTKEMARKTAERIESSLSLDQMVERAKLLVNSKLLPKAIDTPEKAVVIMLMAQEYDITPMKAFQSIYVIDGKPSLSAQLMLALCERTGELEEKKIEPYDTYCRVTLKRKGQSPHVVTFGDDDAKKMQTKEAEYDNGRWVRNKVIPLIEKYNYKTMKKDMYVARAVSRACRWVFPDAVLGLIVHEEAYDVLEADEAAAIDRKADIAEKAEVKKEALAAPTETGTVHDAGAELELVSKIGASFVRDPRFYKMYQDRTISEIYATKTPGGEPKGKQYLEQVAAESNDPEDRANVAIFLEILAKEKA